ncbi:MAG TPA: hypothetical protein VNN79_08050 [Actinomycetota bacterium]|nr:hypothetical protein [Actinomycetota bacterium]
MARADLAPLIAQGHVFVPGKKDIWSWRPMHLEPGVPAAEWTDGYGTTRTASLMGTDHLWNVMGYIRHKLPSSWSRSRFYVAAREELRRRGIF